MKHLLLDIKDGVARVKLNRPEIHNAFNEELIAELTETFRQLEADDAVRLIVLSGEGKSFCAGADLSWMGKMKDYSVEENLADSLMLADMFHTINATTKPVIAAVQGAAMGGGVGLVAVCDYVLADTAAKFGLTEVRLGLVPAAISPFVIAKMGESHARATFLSGERFSAKAAMRFGLVHEVTEELPERLDEVIAEHLKAGPQAVREAKKLIADVLAMQGNPAKQRSHTAEVISRLRVSDEGQEGMSALLEKRKPEWVK